MADTVIPSVVTAAPLMAEEPVHSPPLISVTLPNGTKFADVRGLGLRPPEGRRLANRV